MPEISAFSSLSIRTPSPPFMNYLGVHLKGWLCLTTLDFQVDGNALPTFCVLERVMSRTEDAVGQGVLAPARQDP